MYYLNLIVDFVYANKSAPLFNVERFFNNRFQNLRLFTFSKQLVKQNIIIDFVPVGHDTKYFEKHSFVQLAKG